ncbi:MAG TPA: M14 metallopeptidase family protein [Edaphobacter sp.]|nr:M14 metallopeptidase family protein [Edaphobacter sp.]
MSKLVALLIALISVGAASAQQRITSPEQAFGFRLGADRKLADWTELTAYYKKLASESERIRYEEIGKTTEGRPFVTVTISSAENIAHLDEYRKIQARLADPRVTSAEQAKQLIARGKTVLAVTCNIHSTEIASSQSCAQFAYLLATGAGPESESILHNVIIVMVPSLNPDGQQLVVDWYKKYLGTPYEGNAPVVLWHHYTGHDDNRDWYAFTQVETQLTVNKVLNVWHPQILYDIHQMGAYGPRLYLPPWVDPIDPNIDPLLVSSMNALGTQTALEVAETGKQGILIHGVYDMWSPARHYIAYHGGLRVLTESASANIASPKEIPFDKLDRGIGYDAKVAAWNFPNPWKGGTWRLGDIVAYQMDSLFSIARNAANNREHYLGDFYQISKNAVEQKYGGPYAYVIPAEQTDPAAAARLVNILRTGAVEVEQVAADFDAGGRHYSKSSYIVRLGQPYGPFAKTVLEIQHYPNIEQYPGGPLQRPYDVTAQTLPLLLGVDAIAVQEKFSAPGSAVTKATVSGNVQPSTSGYLIGDEENNGYYALFALLKDNVRAYRLTSGSFSKGTIYIPSAPGVEAKLEAIEKKFPVDIKAAPERMAGSALEVKLPRIGLYQSWVPSMDEGWTRWIFDTNGIPYTRLVDADVRRGDLKSRFDAIILPDEPANAILHGAGAGGRRQSADEPKTPPEFVGGLGEEGMAKLKEFVGGGGTVVALNKASTVYTGKNPGDVGDVLEGVANKDFYVPGSILQVSVDTESPIGFGSKATEPIFFEQSPAFKADGETRSIAHFTSDNPLLSGWLLGGKYLNGASALVEKKQGDGRIILFGFRPQYRGQSEATYKLFYNALLYSSSRAASLEETSAGRDGSAAHTSGRRTNE